MATPRERLKRRYERHDADRGRRRPVLPVAAALAAILTAAVIVVAGMADDRGSHGDVLGATATPALIGQGPGGAGATRSSDGSSTASSTAGGPSAPPSLGPSLTPTPRPTKAPTVRPASPRPTTAPTVRPPSPRPTPAPSVSSPTAAVVDFYEAVAAHQWERGIAQWSETMRQRYPPDEWLIGRFSRTTRIDIVRLHRVALDSAAGTATVSVTLVEYRTVEPSPRTFVGSWDLVRVGHQWLLNQPHF